MLRLALGLLLVGSVAHAQEPASPYVRLDHWAMPYVEHLIAAGVIPDPSPLTRPLRQGDLIAALTAVDTAALDRPTARSVSQVLTALGSRLPAPGARLESHLGLSVATHALRDPLNTRCRPTGAGACTGRDPDPSLGFANGGLGLTLAFGPLLAVTHPYFDTRLKQDPDFFGKKNRFIAGRNAAAYVSAQWRFADVFFGTLDRNWGPPMLPGLLVSASPYGYDHFAARVGTRSVFLDAVITQLDDAVDTAGVTHHRYFVAHRFVVRPPGATTIALWEGTLFSGPGRQLEPWYANVLNLGILAQYNEGTAANNQLGLEIATRVRGVGVFAQLLVDDVQVDNSVASDAEPPSYGVTLAAQGRMLGRRAGWTALYTRVTNLAYRTPDPAEAVQRRFVGLARDFADYDQVTVRVTTIVGPGMLLAPELTLLRQGEGDFRQPYPLVAAYPTTPTTFAGVTERTLRAAVGGSLDLPGRVGLRFDAGMHRVSNAGHVSGRTRTRLVGSLALEYRLTRTWELP
jgi:hypothetical protein